MRQDGRAASGDLLNSLLIYFKQNAQFNNNSFIIDECSELKLTDHAEQ